MKRIKISIWDAKANKLITETVTHEDAIAKRAAQLLGESSGPTLPGFELSCDDKNMGTLAVAVAPFGWALIHTSEDLTQHCTYTGKNQSEESVVDVQWDQPTSIPRAWFVSQSQAMTAIRQWLQDGTLSPAVAWSDECY